MMFGHARQGSCQRPQARNPGGFHGDCPILTTNRQTLVALVAAYVRSAGAAFSWYAFPGKGAPALICPTCKKGITTGPEGNPHRPFCSERCRLVDLGAWLDGGHRISSPLSEEDLEQGSGENVDEDNPIRHLD
jgi:uncharacterized protein